MTIEFKSERFIEDYVCRKLKENNICVISDEECTEFDSQVNLGSYGVADIIKTSFYFDYILVDGKVTGSEVLEVEFTILELKNVLLDERHLSQVLKYKKGLELYLDSINFSYPYKIRCQLAGLKNKSSDFVFLAECVEVECFFIGVTMESGFSSESVGHGYRMSDEYFPKSINLIEKTIDYIDIEIARARCE